MSTYHFLGGVCFMPVIIYIYVCGDLTAGCCYLIFIVLNLTEGIILVLTTR